MPIEKIPTHDRAHWHKLRGQDVTASVVGALFGVHEYESLYGLWAKKTGKMEASNEETDAMRRGRLMEQVAVAMLREDNPEWTVHYNSGDGIYFRDTDARLGGTPDVIVECPQRGRGVIQIKSVAAMIYRDKWINEDGATEPPLWIALQAALEAYLVGAKWAAVAPLVIDGFGGITMPLVEVPLSPQHIAAIKERAADFWRMVEEKREPVPDFAKDGKLIARLHAKGDPELEVDLTSDNRIMEVMVQRWHLKQQEKAIKEQVGALDAEIMAKLGSAEVGLLPDGTKVTWKTQHRKSYTVQAADYRVLRCPTPKEVKEKAA